MSHFSEKAIDQANESRFFNEKRMAFRLFIAELTKKECIKLMVDLYQRIEYHETMELLQRTGSMEKN